MIFVVENLLSARSAKKAILSLLGIRKQPTVFTAANAMSKMTDPEILTLLESMIKFGDSAKAYFA